MHQPIAKPVFNKYPSPARSPQPVEIIHFLSSSPEHIACPARRSDSFIITWFIKGSGMLTIDFTDYPLQPDSLFLLDPHTVFSLDTIRETELEGWHLAINGNYLQESGSNLSDLFFLLRNTGSLQIPEGNVDKLDQLFNLLQSELDGPAYESGPVINSYLTILFSEFRKLSATAGMKPIHHDTRYDEFLELIDKEFRDTRDIESYAAKIHISSKQLNRICKEASGQSAARILEARIYREASRLLHYTNRSVKEISYELGFGEPSYFIKFYRRIGKQTPHQYRRLLSGKHPLATGNAVSGFSLLQLYN